MTKKTKVKQTIEFKKTIIKGREYDTFYLIVNGKNTKCYFGDGLFLRRKSGFQELNIHKESAYLFLKDLKCVQFPTEYDIQLETNIPLKYGKLGLLSISAQEDVIVFKVMVVMMEDDMKKTDLNSLKIMNNILNKLESNYPKTIRTVYDFDSCDSPQEKNKMYALFFEYFGEMKGTLANQVNNLTELLNKTQLELEKEMIANIKKR